MIGGLPFKVFGTNCKNLLSTEVNHAEFWYPDFFEIFQFKIKRNADPDFSEWAGKLSERDVQNIEYTSVQLLGNS